MDRAIVVATAVLLSLVPPSLAGQSATREALVARAAALELDTPYQPPTGSTTSNQAVGYATVMCTGMFISGLDSAFVAENTGWFTAPYEVRASFPRVRIDRASRTVGVTTPDGTERIARLLGSQGCVALPAGATEPKFTPVMVKSALPDANSLPWPMGDQYSHGEWPTAVDRSKVDAAVEAAFDSAGMTAAFLVVYKGQIIAERYGPGTTMTTPLEGWSMGKSVSGTLVGTLVQKGVYTLDQPAPFFQWQAPGDPRGKITIRHILNMSSGLRIRAPQDPDYDATGPYPDHLWYYTGAGDAADWAATRPQQWAPNTVGRYRNTDPVLANYLVRLGADKLGVPHLEYPQRALFDKIGVRNFVILTDPYGNFLLHGAELAPARDWARIAQLHLQDGVWNDERILPVGWVDFVSSLAPAWVADGRPTYGGLFWINGESAFPVPTSAYYMSGVGGNTTLIVPTHDLIVVRMGHYRGQGPGGRALREAVRLLMEAVPPS